MILACSLVAIMFKLNYKLMYKETEDMKIRSTTTITQICVHVQHGFAIKPSYFKDSSIWLFDDIWSDLF